QPGARTQGLVAGAAAGEVLTPPDHRGADPDQAVGPADGGPAVEEREHAGLLRRDRHGLADAQAPEPGRGAAAVARGQPGLAAAGTLRARLTARQNLGDLALLDHHRP